jgi:phosphatidylserine/phosphatidylglycerophosphate/cardiolipin synthase-like enzyme
MPHLLGRRATTARRWLGVLAAMMCLGALPAASAAATPSTLTLLTEPGAGVAPIYGFLESARHSLDLTMYELVDPAAEAILARDAVSGVRVRVLLDRTGEETANDPAYRYLSARGVSVRWASSRYDRTHEKAAVIDGSRAVVMTLNLVSQDYAGTRDFAVLDAQPSDVAAIETVFQADWSATALAAPRGVDLVWSPGSESAIVSLIDSAQHRLLVENEEMDDRYITTPLENAAQRGVDVEIVMTRDPEWNAALDALSAAGAHVRTYSQSASLYIHAKAIVADPSRTGARAFVGSENFSIASLIYNRELGLITAAGGVVHGVSATIEGDFAGATPWHSS